MKIPNARGLSRLGPRGTFGIALQAVAEEDPRVVGLTADLAITAGMDRFRLAFPDRFVNVGIAEQNLVGVASGLADDGWVPFAVTFANFAALRSCEFVRHHLGYMRQNVTLVGIGAGFAMGQFGNTHYSLEDVSALRAIPNLAIISPADCTEVVGAVRAAAAYDGPVYLRLNGVPSMPVVDQGDKSLVIGEANALGVGSDLTFIANGSMVARSLAAAERLGSLGFAVGVVNMHTIKPLDEAAVRGLVGSTQAIVTVEEHSRIGGLGSAVAEVLAGVERAPKLLRVGVPDRFPLVGEYDYVLDQCGLSVESIAAQAQTLLTESATLGSR